METFVNISERCTWISTTCGNYISAHVADNYCDPILKTVRNVKCSWGVAVCMFGVQWHEYHSRWHGKLYEHNHGWWLCQLCLMVVGRCSCNMFFWGNVFWWFTFWELGVSLGIHPVGFLGLWWFHFFTIRIWVWFVMHFWWPNWRHNCDFPCRIRLMSLKSWQAETANIFPLVKDFGQRIGNLPVAD